MESEKDRIKNADLKKISEQLKEYEKFSKKIEINFKEEYDTFVLNFIKDIKNRLNNELKEVTQTARMALKKRRKIPNELSKMAFVEVLKDFGAGFLERIGVMNQALKPER
ncbi:hypothetical protein HpCK22_07140 [Helicobacter pylori]